MTWIKYPKGGGFGIGQRQRHVRLCRLDVIATHQERERERERADLSAYRHRELTPPLSPRFPS